MKVASWLVLQRRRKQGEAYGTPQSPLLGQRRRIPAGTGHAHTDGHATYIPNTYNMCDAHKLREKGRRAGGREERDRETERQRGREADRW